MVSMALGTIIFRAISMTLFLLISVNIVCSLYRLYIKKEKNIELYDEFVQAAAVGYAMVVSLVLAMGWY